MPIGCGLTEPEPLFGQPPRRAAIRIVELPGRIDGVPAEAGSPDHRARNRWRAGDAWSRESTDGSVRFTSPDFGPDGLPNPGRFNARLRPAGATRVIVVPHARGGQLEREHRQLRRLVLELAGDAHPGHTVEIEVDLYEALHGNFGDAGRGGVLEKLEIELPDADPAAAELLDASIESRRQLASDDPAGMLVVDHGGVLRPTWYARGGVAASFELQVPADSPELRWHDACVSACGDRVVEVVSGGKRTELWREVAVAADGGARWTLRSLPLARFAGRSVELSLRVEGSGVGLFGDPRVLSLEAQTKRSNGTASPTTRRARASDVLVYMIDTLRADRLGVGGSSVPAVSPTIDQLARTGAWFEMALSSSPWTKPAIATLMSGILPNTHGVGAASYTDRMPPTVPLVQERFRAAGWRTASFSASPLGSTLSALDRGFAAAFPPRFWSGRAELDMNPSASQLSAALLDWIDEEPDRPFFAYVHTLEVHEWKLPRYQQDLPRHYTSYDAAVHDADLHLGRLLDELERRGRRNDLLIVIVSDHGESWGDHGLPSHGFGLFQSQIHVPLIFWSGRGLRPERIPAPVSLADLAPTLLDGFGLPPLREADGRSLGGYLRGDPPEQRPVLSSLLRFVWAPEAPQQFAITTPQRLKLIRTSGAPGRAFDLVIDPQETHPLEHPSAVTVRELDRVLASQARRAVAFRERHGDSAPGSVRLDDVVRLRALGYLPESEGDPAERHEHE